MAAPNGPPSTADLLLGSLSQYSYDRHLHQREVPSPEFGLRQYFTYTAPKQPLDDRRGETLLTNRRHEPRLEAPAQVQGDVDPRASIRRHYVDTKRHGDDEAPPKADDHAETLRFRVFFEEEVIGSAIERSRARVLQLWWYHATGEVRLFEPRQDNAGLVQGEFLRKSKVSLVTEDGTRPLELSDLACAGAVIRIASPPLTLTLMDADAYSRRWLAANGRAPFGDPIPAPASYSHPPTRRVHDWARPTTVAHDRGFETNAALGFFSRSPDARGRFEAARGRVLRFEGLLDERSGPAGATGDLVVVALHYYLEDETVEVIAPEAKNSGRGTTKLLSRQRVPRAKEDLAPAGLSRPSAIVPPPELGPAAAAPRTRPATAGGASAATPALPPRPPTRGGAAASAEPTRHRIGLLSPAEAAAEARASHAAHRGQARYRFSPGSWSGTYVSPITGTPLYGAGGVADALDSGAARAPVTHVTPDLLRAGSWITVFGKRIWLRRADPFTVAWFRESMDVDQTELAGSGPITSAAPRRPTRTLVPPHTGPLAIGDEEETRRNAGKLVPTWRQRPDMDSFFECDGRVLAFRARLANPRPEDEGRRFVVSFFLVDGTLAINETLLPNTGRWGTRYLERGRYRNALRTGALHAGEDADNSFADPALRATVMARERALGGVGAVYGYGHGFGQGYAGGSLGKEDRTGAGCTGVAPLRGIGIRERLPFAPEPPLLRAEDLAVGGRLVLAHSPGAEFLLTGADAFTKRWLRRNGRAGAAGATSDDDDGGGGSSGVDEAPDADSLEGGGRGEGSPAHGPAARVAPVLAGCLASARRAMLSRDRRDTGRLPVGTATAVLAAYGACPPVVNAADVAALMAQFLCDEREDGELLVRWPALCDALVAAAHSAAASGLTAGEGDPVEGARIEQQLRSAILSSRSHLRRCFRELGRACPGAISHGEFRGLLRRHHLDLGMTAADVAAAMSRYPPASLEEAAEEAACRGVPAPSALPAGAISWKGFLMAITGAGSGAASVSPEEVAEIANIARGVTLGLEHGAGHAPEHFPHPPRASAWGRANVAWDDGTGSGWQAKDVSEEEATLIRDRLAPPSQADTLERSRPHSRGTPSCDECSCAEAAADSGLGATVRGFAEAQRAFDREIRSRAHGPVDGASEGVEPSDAGRSPEDAAAPAPAEGSRAALLARLSAFFTGRRWELHRTLRLFDPAMRGTIARPSFRGALVAAGFELTPEEEETLLGSGAETSAPVQWRPLLAEITAAAEA
ncbi:hypothetical protein FNF31_02580 [Cafeteria roenbergensis]|uniref:DM10 domain-containing protein n=1 Tax=Cafeteria roenbergensis TaxID=33653 RepID=A0A5A8DJK5_CAFRO|nr:hypothetical protein FNF31_02580 [Cafeteria roenbergensis]